MTFPRPASFDPKTDTIKCDRDGTLTITHTTGCGKTYTVPVIGGRSYGSAADFCEHCDEAIRWPQQEEVFEKTYTITNDIRVEIQDLLQDLISLLPSGCEQEERAVRAIGALEIL